MFCMIKFMHHHPCPVGSNALLASLAVVWDTQCKLLVTEVYGVLFQFEVFRYGICVNLLMENQELV